MRETGYNLEEYSINLTCLLLLISSQRAFLTELEYFSLTISILAVEHVAEELRTKFQEQFWTNMILMAASAFMLSVATASLAVEVELGNTKMMTLLEDPLQKKPPKNSIHIPVSGMWKGSAADYGAVFLHVENIHDRGYFSRSRLFSTITGAVFLHCHGKFPRSLGLSFCTVVENNHDH